MSDNRHADGRAGIDAALVRRLVAAQFPQWSGLPVEPVEVDGWDNRTYRLGPDMTVRLPTGPTYALAVEKEHRWLPVLAPRLPVEIPEPLGLGRPGEGYPHHWAVRRWIDGQTADPSRIDDMTAFAEAVAGFITALQAADPTGGPAGGEHSFQRGADPAHYDAQTRETLRELEGRVDTAAAARVWEAALAARWTGEPVWFHGDIAQGNLLTRDGKLAAVIDFGTSGVGDPACDLVIAWTMFEGASREAFRRAVAQDEATWARARGWAIWKALLLVSWDHAEAQASRRVIDAVIAEHEALR
ncbi:aminoglycoside phosphotransferase family protein [Glycomyces terrestris]|uniref:Aminoglycoside phosphotransferase family protein n=1 Tax=Glycomyces terrestris TaxID=2493553 RepID=A0A426UT04_9ACTN|nr:aminoglycoside phosphotransferase family protein [Glycomyces terrestris]RRR96806.1 aminoglycoside phosphotransferase family protein [Glycomyces terrestris]